MSGPYLVGVDCGTQSAKVVIYDHTGNPVAEGRQVLRPMDRPRHGVAVHPDDDIWTSIASASRQAMAAFIGDVGEIVAVGICPIRCCKTFLDADGELIEPVMSWMDDRAYQPYLPDDPRLAYATTLSGYVAHRFTGRFVDTAANNIVGQWPIDSDRWTWSDDASLLQQFNLQPGLLFELQMPGDVIGTLTVSASAATGLPAGIPVVATANDKAVEMLGAGTLSPSTALVSLGTYIAAMMNGTENHPAPANFWTNFACIPNRYLYESNGVRRGMWTLTWFLDLLGPEFAAHTASIGISREAFLEREAAVVPSGSDGLMTVLDWLAPADKPFRKGMMIGFDARHTRGHIYRSILEAIALTMKNNVDAMCTELGVSFDQIMLSGGGSGSALFMQIFADVFGVPAVRAAHGGASLGAAMCAAAAVGVYPDIESAASAMAAPRESFTPSTPNGAIYQQMLDAVYCDIRQATDGLLAHAYPVFHPITATDPTTPTTPTAVINQSESD
jgi:sugar (pentulose or hexulose) kinase